MKNNKDIGIGQVIMYTIMAQIILIAIQFAYFMFYTKVINPDAEMIFNTAYIKQKGFYIFQVIGLFVYTTLAFFVLRLIKTDVLTKMLTLFITGGIIELIFYLSVPAGYEGVFLFSILDKAIAIVFGFFIYFMLKPDEHRTEVD